MLKRKNKRGDATDFILILVILFFLVISFTVGNLFLSKIKTTIETTPLNETSASSGIISQLNTLSTKTIDRSIVMILAFMIIGMMASSFLTRIHPAFIFIWIIFAAFAIILAALIGNAYSDFSEVSAFETEINNQPMTDFLMTHIVKITLIMAAISMIITFTKATNTTGGGADL